MTERDEDAIREVFEEYDLEAKRVAMIADPENERAWIQSDLVRAVER